MPFLRSDTSPVVTKMLPRPQMLSNPACYTTVEVFDAERDGGIQTIFNHADELAETSRFDDTDIESWQGFSNSEFEDLDHVLSRATSIANCRPEEEAADQSAKAFQAGAIDDTEVQSAQEPFATTVPDSDKGLDAIAEFLNHPRRTCPGCSAWHQFAHARQRVRMLWA